MNRLEGRIHPFLTEEAVLALRTKQVFTVLDFIKADTQLIIRDARLNFREVLAVKNFLLKKFSPTPINLFDCYKTALNNTAIIPTGLEGVDHLLNGGLFTGNIHEICGLPAAGKTWFVLSLIKNVICSTDQQVHLFDTKSDFSARRMQTILNGYGKPHQEQLLNRIVLHRTYTKHDLINSLYDVKKNLNNKKKLRLIIIDSLPCVIFSSSDHSANNTFLNHLANIMRYIATEHHCAFLITNLIRTWNDGGFKTVDPSENIACGRYWLGVPNTRLKIEKLESTGLCRVTVLSSDTLSNKINNSTDIQLCN